MDGILLEIWIALFWHFSLTTVKKYPYWLFWHKYFGPVSWTRCWQKHTVLGVQTVWNLELNSAVQFFWDFETKRIFTRDGCHLHRVLCRWCKIPHFRNHRMISGKMEKIPWWAADLGWRRSKSHRIREPPDSTMRDKLSHTAHTLPVDLL